MNPPSWECCKSTVDMARPSKTFPIVITWSRGRALEEVSVLSLRDLSLGDCQQELR